MVTASITSDTATLIARIFDEAERRDPNHTRRTIGLVDGNNHQIDRLTKEATNRGIDLPILIDFVHVLEYLWDATWSFHNEGDPAAETWVRTKALDILNGKARIVAAAIRRKATANKLTATQRKGADKAATYLTNKAPYLDYPTALANGWPIATGIIEGACRHLVADRLDITGAAGDSKAPKPSSNSGPYEPTATSTNTGPTTPPRNTIATTTPATTTRT